MIEVRIAFPSDIIESSGRTYNTNKLSSIIEEETKWANEANTMKNYFYIAVSIIYLIAVIINIFLWLCKLLSTIL